MNAYTIDPRIAPYIRALREEGESWRVRPSETWKVLNDLYSSHGQKVVDALLEAHWKQPREVRQPLEDAL